MNASANSSNEPLKQQKTRRQHWLPQNSYLKYFTEDGKVTAYLLKDRDRANFLQTAKKIKVTTDNIGHKRDLYETPDLPDNTFENLFADIEVDYAQVMEQKILLGKPLTKKDHHKVSIFVSVLENRTPSQRAHLHQFLAQLEETGRAMSMAHDAPEAAERWSRQIEVTRKRFFGMWLANVVDMNKWGVLDFCFLVIPDYIDIDYITCDHPVTLHDFAASNSPFGLNQWHKTAECVVPLSSRIALFANNCGIKGYKETDYNFVREVNMRVLTSAQTLVISSGDFPEKELDALKQRHPQSMLVRFAKLPKGNTDRIVERSKKEEQQK
jgi:hypothetical protein